MWRGAAAPPAREPADAGAVLELSARGNAVGWRILHRVSNRRELWALTDQALVSGANFITCVLLARTLGLSEFGVYSLSWMVVLLASTLQQAVIVSPMMSVGPKQSPEERRGYYGAVTAHELFWAVLSGVCVYSGTAVFAHWFPSWNARPLAFPVAAATATYLAQDFARRYFFTIQRNGLALACDALSYLTQLPLLWWLAERGSLSTGRALIIIAATSLFAVLVSVFWRRDLRCSAAMVRSVASRNWKLARWLAPSALMQWTSQNAFMLAAPVYYGAAAAGALRACQNIVAIAHIWFLGLDNVMPAEAARRLHERGLDASMRYIRNMLLRWGLITAAFMLVIGAAPSFWLHLLYSTRYAQFGYVLRLYGVLYVMIFLGGPLRAALQALEYTAPMLWSYTAMTGFALLVAAPLAKLLGLRGVMLGLIATQLVFQSILAIALVLRVRRMRAEQQSAPPVSFIAKESSLV